MLSFIGRTVRKIGGTRTLHSPGTFPNQYVVVEKKDIL